MSISHGWDNKEKTTYRFNLDAQWNWAEFAACITEASVVISPPNEIHLSTVDVIFCFNTHLPFGSTLQHLIRGLDALPVGVTRILIVNKAGAFLDLMVSKLDKAFYGNRVMSVNSLDQAYDVLKMPLGVTI